MQYSSYFASEGLPSLYHIVLCPSQVSEKQLYETEKKFKMFEAMINVMEEEVKR
jgi:hypothetical protein